MRRVVWWVVLTLLFLSLYVTRELLVALVLATPLILGGLLLFAICYGLGATVEKVFWFMKRVVRREVA